VLEAEFVPEPLGRVVSSSRHGSPMTDDQLVGTTLAGKYLVEDILGRGGMGLVLGARHIKLDEPVAIKLLRPSLLDVDGMVTRFLREARAASKIKSAHVVRVTDVDTLDDGVPYMVMERLVGNDLSELRKKRGQLGVAEAVSHVLEATEAIAEAHQLGIVHRDLKPSNLFLHRAGDRRPVVKVLDFGISKVEAAGEQDTTKTGQMMGSPRYMSPEQMLSMHDVDGRSDIWSLGAILYELIVGQPPFVAETTPKICALVLHGDPPLPSARRPEIPPGLERAILRCLAKAPAERFQTVAELAEAIAPFGPPPESVLTHSGAHARVSALASGPSSALPSTLPLREPPGAAPALVITPAALPELATATPSLAVSISSRAPETATPPTAGPRRGMLGVVAGIALVSACVAILATRQTSAPGALPSGTPAAEPPASVAEPEARRANEGTSKTDAPTADAAKTAYSLADLPDVRLPAAGRPPAASGSAAVAPRPKPTATDPFGGRRN
jgi:serine/threonine-protein kinase